MTLAKRLLLAAGGLLALVAVLGVGGVQVPWSPTETTQQKPYADFVGREYRVISSVSAYAWNDYPDKAKIQSFSLLPPPGVRNRFVSYVTPLQPGQRARIISAWRHFLLLGFHRYYVVSVPGAGLPEGIEITIGVDSDGIPDPHVYKPIGEQCKRGSAQGVATTSSSCGVPNSLDELARIWSRGGPNVVADFGSLRFC